MGNSCIKNYVPFIGIGRFTTAKSPMHKQSLFKISNFILIAFYSSAAVQCVLYVCVYLIYIQRNKQIHKRRGNCIRKYCCTGSFVRSFVCGYGYRYVCVNGTIVVFYCINIFDMLFEIVFLSCFSSRFSSHTHFHFLLTVFIFLCAVFQLLSSSLLSCFHIHNHIFISGVFSTDFCKLVV